MRTGSSWETLNVSRDWERGNLGSGRMKENSEEALQGIAIRWGTKVISSCANVDELEIEICSLSHGSHNVPHNRKLLSTQVMPRTRNDCKGIM